MTEYAFADIAMQSAHAFRAIMNAMARPGRCLAFAPDVEAPPPLDKELAAVALTLCDYQSAVWLSPRLDVEPVRRYLRFHTGAPLVNSPGACAFALVAQNDIVPRLSDFAQGSDEYPDQSATLVIAVRSLTEGAGVALSGPGIAAEHRLLAEGLAPGFWSEFAENNVGFPVGLDAILVSPGVIAACPRSSVIRFVEPV